MEKSVEEKVIMAALTKKYRSVKPIGDGLYVVETHSDWVGQCEMAIYCGRKKEFLVWCQSAELRAKLEDMVVFYSYKSRCFTVFSCKKREAVCCGHRCTRFDLCEPGRFLAHFVDKKSDDEGMGVCSVHDDEFVVPPVYEDLIFVEEGLYYGVKKSSVGKTYHLIHILDGKMTEHSTERMF